MPYDVENGGRSIRNTVDAIEQLDLSENDKTKIYEGNARRLLRL